MAIINPDGLFNGERLRMCSNAARLHWPYLLLASNGFGRLEIDYYRIVAKAFSSFKPLPSEEELMSYFKEYFNAHLIFLYRSDDGALWGQWDCPARYLNKYQTAADRRSPTPPDPAFSEWRDAYAHGSNKSIPASLTDISVNCPRLSGNSSTGFSKDLPFGIGDGEVQNLVRKSIPPTRANPERAEKLAKLLQDGILLNNPKAKITSQQLSQWAVEADRMLRIDGRQWEEIAELIRWSQKDPFWLKNILSMGKLREQFDRLTLQRDGQSGNRSGLDVDDVDNKPGRPKWLGLTEGDQKENK